MSTNEPRPFSNSWVASSIRTHGMVIIAVGSGQCSEPGCDGGHPIDQPWSYTIGRVEIGRPELVVYGLNPADAHALLTRVDQRDRHGGPMALGSVEQVEGRTVRLDRVPAWWIADDDDPMGRWFAYYHGTGRMRSVPDVLQVVVADDRGVLPDDAACDPRVRRAQPVLRDAPHPLPRRPSHRMPRTPGHVARRHRRRPA